MIHAQAFSTVLSSSLLETALLDRLRVFLEKGEKLERVSFGLKNQRLYSVEERRNDWRI